MRRVVSAAVLAVSLVLACAGCGVGSSGNRTVSTGPAATMSAVDAETAALATKGVVRRSDVGAGWVQHAAAPGSAPLRADDCAQRPDGPLSKLAPGASQAGPSLQVKGNKHVNLSSRSLVFPEDADVDAYLAIRSSSQWHDCRRKQLEAKQRKTHPRRSVVTTRQTSPAVGTGHLVAFSVFTVMSHPKGKPAAAAATATESAYRFGRVVVSIRSDVSSTEDVGSKLKSATTTAVLRLAARLDAG